ncbi:MAG: hypothetical protein HYZ53_14585 [Planctomycetes bacterium]|nr:hypothetical protein [Planctomycetota bacterium]
MAEAIRSWTTPPRGRMQIFRALLRETTTDTPVVATALGATAATAHLLAAGPTLFNFLGLLGCGAATLSLWTVNYFFRTQHFLDRVKSKWRAEDEARLQGEIGEVERSLKAKGLGREAEQLRELLRLRAELEKTLGDVVFSFQRDDIVRATREIVLSGMEALRHLLRVEEQRGRFPLEQLERERFDVERQLKRLRDDDPLLDSTRKKLALADERLALARSLEAKRAEIAVTLDRSRHVLEKALVEPPDGAGGEETRLTQCLDYFNEQVEVTRKVNEGLRGELAPRVR